MNVTLIEPAMIRTTTFREKWAWRLQPLTLAALAGLTPPEVTVRAFDDRLENIDFDAPCDLAGISIQTFTARRAYQIADEYRRREVPVVLGGHHATLLPSEAARHADAVVTGEAETVWPRVLSDAAAGRLRQHYATETLQPYRDVRTDRSVLADKRYLPVAMVETARGCPHKCSFCSVTTVFGGRLRRRPTAEVVTEVAGCRERVVMFVDDNIVGDIEGAKDLFRRLATLGIKWVGQASLTMARDRELLALMRESGCQGVLVGIESISPDSLAQARKSWNQMGPGYDEALRIVQDHGIAVVGSFVLGMDGDTEQSLDATLEFAVRNRLFAAMFNLLTPYPGTDLYNELAATNRLLLPTWWLDPDFRYGSAVFRPRHIDPETLEERRLAMYRAFYGARSTGLRLIAGSANLRDPWRVLAYLALNLTAVRDERARHGLALGDGAPT